MLEALRLSLRDNRASLWCLFAGLAKLHLGNEEEVGRVLRPAQPLELRNRPRICLIITAVGPPSRKPPGLSAAISVMPASQQAPAGLLHDQVAGAARAGLDDDRPDACMLESMEIRI